MANFMIYLQALQYLQIDTLKIWALTHPKLCKILYMYANELCYENKKHTWLTSSFEKTAEQSLVKCLSLDSRLFNDVVQETIFGTSDSFGTFWLLNFLTSKCGHTLGAGPGRSSSPCCKSTNQLGTCIPGENEISTILSTIDRCTY